MALLVAAHRGHLRVLQYLLNEARANIMVASEDNSTALHLASSGGHLEIVKFLVAEARMDLEAPGLNGATSMLTAAYL
eukprot:6135623-Karenia_brevis.AAC.1